MAPRRHLFEAVQSTEILYEGLADYFAAEASLKRVGDLLFSEGKQLFYDVIHI